MNIIKKYSFLKDDYANIIICLVLYFASSFLLKQASTANGLVKGLNKFIELSSLRGMLTQVQMLISVYLALRQNKAGYKTAVIINIFGIFSSLAFSLRNKVSTSLPGLISYVGVIIIVSLINNYKTRNSAHLEKIEHQKNALEISEGKLFQMAYYDVLTNLPNKELFVTELLLSINKAKRDSTLIGVMFLDLDSFKSVNDSMGHTAGDFVLKEVSQRLSSSLRKSDTVSRFSGDEFVMQIPNIEKTEELIEISNKIMDSFNEPINVFNNEFFISISSGVAIYPIDGNDPETLIKNADMAMYSAKNNGKNQLAFYSEKLKNNFTQNIKLTNSLYRALDRNELFLYYQPQVDAYTQEIIGFEALLRWKSEEQGMISPNVFIPIAEKTGLIKPIGLWIIKTVLEQCRRCRNTYKKEMRISINISLEQLKDASIVSKISKMLEDTETNAKNLQIEITESIAFNEDPYVLQRIHQLKNLGFSIAIDDFGKAHSSFSRLKTFPIDLIKIDMEFVRGISSQSQKDKAIIRSIIQLSKNLGIKVLAEGVETEEQYRYLLEENCDEIQGYYFYKPMISDDVIKIMNERFL